MTRRSLTIFIFAFYLGCICEFFIDENGFGNCTKEFNNQIGCYVDEPTTCNDAKKYRGKFYSTSEACRRRIGE